MSNSSAIWRLGSSSDFPASPYTKPGVVLMGGGNDVAQAFEWQIRNAAGGDFVVLRTYGTSDYNPWIFNLSMAINSPLNSVTTLLMDPSDSTNQTFLNYIQNAEAIFFAGGDQSTYMDQWVNTPVQSIIQGKLSSVTVGGTSAGLAILGGYVYSAQSEETITSAVALIRPNNPNITLVKAFLDIPLLQTVITDTHFVSRNRMGRMQTFLARLLVPTISDSIPPVPLASLRGLGVDEETAILLNVTTGVGTVVGSSTAYLCSPTVLPKLCGANLCVPLTFSTIHCYRYYGHLNQSLDFHSFEPVNVDVAVPYFTSIVNGIFTERWPLQYGPLPNPSFPLNGTGQGSVTVPLDGSSGWPIVATLASVLACLLLSAASLRCWILRKAQRQAQLSSTLDSPLLIHAEDQVPVRAHAVLRT